VSGYCNIYNIIDLRVAGATVYGHLRCPDIAIFIILDLRVAGVTVYGHLRCPDIAISIILLTCELQVRLFMDT
jgi:hypothetical protein